MHSVGLGTLQILVHKRSASPQVWHLVRVRRVRDSGAVRQWTTDPTFLAARSCKKAGGGSFTGGRDDPVVPEPSDWVVSSVDLDTDTYAGPCGFSVWGPGSGRPGSGVSCGGGAFPLATGAEAAAEAATAATDERARSAPRKPAAAEQQQQQQQQSFLASHPSSNGRPVIFANASAVTTSVRPSVAWIFRRCRGIIRSTSS